MSRLTVAGAVCALWLAASPASAEPFTTYVDLCLGTNVDLQAAGARAKAVGWFSVPPEELGMEESFRDPAIYLSVDPATFGDKGVPADLEMLMTGWGRGEEVFGVADVRMDACVVMGASGDVGTLRARLQALLGLPPINLDGQEIWVFSREGSGFRSEAALMDLDEDALPRIAREKKVYMAGVIDEEDVPGLMLATFRPD